jgi:hypothetical protein
MKPTGRVPLWALRLFSGGPDDKGAAGGRKLALVPLILAVLLGALMLPRRAHPDVVPLPPVDDRELTRIIAVDHGRAETARRQTLSGSVRELGSKIRDFHLAEVEADEPLRPNLARTAIDRTLPRALESGGVEEVLRLRALQLEEFLAEVQRFEAKGVASKELDAVGGTYIRTMTTAGWAAGRRVFMNDAERRSAFKVTWNKLVGVEGRHEFSLLPDENRVLYGFYFRHPHAPESKRDALRTRWLAANDRAACDRIADEERVAENGWLLQKLKEYASTDPSYPLTYARGVALFQRHEYVAAAQAFQDWLDEHPNGPWTLRARNHREAALAEAPKAF